MSFRLTHIFKYFPGRDTAENDLRGSIQQNFVLETDHVLQLLDCIKIITLGKGRFNLHGTGPYTLPDNSVLRKQATTTSSFQGDKHPQHDYGDRVLCSQYRLVL